MKKWNSYKSSLANEKIRLYDKKIESNFSYTLLDLNS
jgi:hypothetical protein